MESGCGGLLGWSLGYSSGYLIENRHGVNNDFKDRNIVGLELGERDVESLVRYDGVRGRKDLRMISGKKWRIRVK